MASICLTWASLALISSAMPIRSSSFAKNLSEAQIEAAVKRSADNRTLGTVTTVLGTPIAIVVIGLLWRRRKKPKDNAAQDTSPT